VIGVGEGLTPLPSLATVFCPNKELLVTTIVIANLLGVQHELVRDAAGEMFGRVKGEFTYQQAMGIRTKLAQWGKLA
jgi:hypothetical protein